MTALLYTGTDMKQRYAISIDIIGSTTLGGPWPLRVKPYYLTLIYAAISGMAELSTYSTEICFGYLSENML